MKLINIKLIILIFLASSINAFAVIDVIHLGSFGKGKSWQAKQFNEGSSKICYIISSPIATSPDGLNRSEHALMISNYPGDKTKLLILSDKIEETIFVTLDAYPDSDEMSEQEDNSDEEEFDLIGLMISNSDTGVEIKKIDKQSNAYRSGLRNGDIILSIENQKIQNKKDYKDAISKYEEGDIIMMKKSRNGRPTFIAFNIN